MDFQIANAKKAEPRETKEEGKSSLAEKHPTSATSCSPVFLYKHPSLVPFFWPSVPSSNFTHLQYLSHSDVTSLSEHSSQCRDMSSSDIGITEPVNPLFVLPLPLALPFPIYGAPLTYSDTNKRPNETPSGHPCSMSSTSDNLFVAENNELSPKPNALMKASSCRRSMPAGNAIGTGFTHPVNSGDHHTGHRLEFTLLTPEKLSCIKPVESVGPVRNSQENNISDPYAPSATDNMLETLPKKAEPAACRHKKPENVFAATKARRRRKEVMMLKNVECHHTRTQTANS